MIFFTSDHHFGHANIIKYCNRPFSSVEEMDEELIKRWNERIQPGDRVYHLGDFTLGNRELAVYYFSQLNGSIYVLKNDFHHDCRWLSTSQIDILRVGKSHYIEFLPPLVSLKFPELTKGKYSHIIVLCHYPMAKWDRSHYGSWHLFGHSHGQFENVGLSYDVGVDNNDFYPVSLDDVKEIMAKKGNLKCN